MSSRLWDVFDGEPFMDNPRLGILGLINPRKKKGRKVARFKKGSKAAKAYMASIRPNRKRRRNPFPVGGLVVNPRRRRKGGGGKRSASRGRHRQRIVLENRRHRRRSRRNPAILGFQVPALQPVLYAGAGFAGSIALESVLTSGTTPIIPVTITGTTLGKYAVRVGCVVATAYLAKMMLGGEKAKMVGIGGGVYVLTSAIKEFAPGIVPGMAAYRPLNGMGTYRGLNAARVVPFGRNGSAQVTAQLSSVAPSSARYSRYGR